MTRRKVVLVATLAALAIVVGAIAVGIATTHGTSGARSDASPLASALAYRGRVGWFGAATERSFEGVTFVAIRTDDALGRALVADDPAGARAALDGARLRTVVLDVTAARRFPETSFLGRLGRLGVVDGFRTLYLESGLAVVEPLDLPAFSAAERAAVPRIARQILGGGTPPRMSQFPTHLRAPVPVEVMLALRRSDGSLALWRSARASSVASGLLTTTRVAMERWDARRENLGPPLAESIRDFDVEVAILVDDGTLGTRADGFLDQVVTRDHGVAYDDNASWHYLLPDAPERVSAGSGSAAFRALFTDNQRRVDSADDAAIRLYRLRVLPLGTDRASDARHR